MPLGLGIAGIVMGVLTLVEQGVVTATRAKSLIQQGESEGWDEVRWQQELTALAEQSDSLYADASAVLQELTSPEPE